MLFGYKLDPDLIYDKLGIFWVCDDLAFTLYAVEINVDSLFYSSFITANFGGLVT